MSIKNIYAKHISKYVLNKELVTFFIFVVVAFMLWFLNALNKEYTTNVNYRVEYVNFPKNKLPKSKLPSAVIATYRTTGFAIVSNSLFKNKNGIIVDFNEIKPLKVNDSLLTYVINSASINSEIIESVGSKLKLQDFYPSEIKVDFVPAVTKKIMIRPCVRFDFATQYIQKGDMSFNPSEVELTGPKSLMDTIQYVPTESVEFRDLSADTKKTLSLEIPSVAFSERRLVDVRIQVEKYTELKRKLPVSVINLPDTLVMRLFPNELDLSYDVGLSKYSQSLKDEFRFVVDYNDIKQSGFLTVKKHIVPSYVKNVTWSPQKIDFLLEPKK